MEVTKSRSAKPQQFVLRFEVSKANPGSSQSHCGSAGHLKSASLLLGTWHIGLAIQSDPFADLRVSPNTNNARLTFGTFALKFCLTSSACEYRLLNDDVRVGNPEWTRYLRFATPETITGAGDTTIKRNSLPLSTMMNLFTIGMPPGPGWVDSPVQSELTV
jgi:hypothetical protein